MKPTPVAACGRLLSRGGAGGPAKGPDEPVDADFEVKT